MRRAVYGPGEDQKNPEDYSKTTSAWFLEDKKKIGACLVETGGALLNDQSDYLSECESNLRMFRNLQNSGTLPFRFLKTDSQGQETSHATRRVGLNMVRPMVNTVASKIGKERPRMMYHTDGAGRTGRKAAKEIQLYRDGLMYARKAYRHSTRALVDGLIMGTGIVRVQDSLGTTIKNRKVEFKRIFTPQFLVDRVQGDDGCPRDFYEFEFIDKYELAYRFKEHEARILGMKCNWLDLSNLWWKNFDKKSEHSTLMIWRGYHLPSEEGADDGVWACGIGDLTLDTGPWKDAFSPYAEYRWIQSPHGYYGMGICEESRGLQGEVNRIMRRIQAAMILHSAPYVFIDKNAGVEAAHMRGIPGNTIKYNRVKPEVVAPSVINGEVFSHLDRCFQRGFESVGVSQMSATARIPANLESGRAVLVHDDVQSERFALQGRGWQELHQDMDERALACAARIDDQVPIIDPVSKQLRKCKWSELKVDGFVIKASATSLLPTEPAGKIDILERLDKQGLILDPEEKLSQFDDPDLEAFTNRHTAASRYYESLFEKMIYQDAPYEPPDSALPLAKAIDKAQQMYIEALNEEGVSQKALQKVQTWIFTAMMMEDARKQRMAAAAPPLPAALPGAPPVGPTPLPGGGAPALPPLPGMAGPPMEGMSDANAPIA